MDSNPQSATIVRAVIGLARGLELPVLAEGVETKEQLAFLAKESCDEIQGYLIGRPLPIGEYAALTGTPARRRAPAQRQAESPHHQPPPSFETGLPPGPAGQRNAVATVQMAQTRRRRL